ncbi:MAG: hypothetical protein HY506_01880 [Candidatus Yanofskybacteria bacterium]|nr:hypothetical protein [Candidatus Yanofskybacteria bacterium]
MTKKQMITVLVLVATLIASGALLYWRFFGRGKFETGELYRFKYTFRADLNVKGIRGALAGRTFVMEDGGTFSVPLKGPRGEPIAVPDGTLPDNSFRLVERESPELRVGPTFQAAYEYLEVRYHFLNPEPQETVPRLTPTNKR